MASHGRQSAQAYAEVYHLNATARRVDEGEYVELSDGAVAMLGGLLFAFAGALSGALLHI